MKKFELFLGITMITITVLIDVIAAFTITPYMNNLILMVIVSLLGFCGGILLIDSHILRVETHYYLKGYDDCLETIEESKKKFSFNNIH